MATTPTTFQPAFKRVVQQGRDDDTFAAIAILTGKTLDSIMRQAETMGLPKIGPFHSYIDGDLIARIPVREPQRIDGHQQSCSAAIRTPTGIGVPQVVAETGPPRIPDPARFLVEAVPPGFAAN